MQQTTTDTHLQRVLSTEVIEMAKPVSALRLMINSLPEPSRNRQRAPRLDGKRWRR